MHGSSLVTAATCRAGAPRERPFLHGPRAPRRPNARWTRSPRSPPPPPLPSPPRLPLPLPWPRPTPLLTCSPLERPFLLPRSKSARLRRRGALWALRGACRPCATANRSCSATRTTRALEGYGATPESGRPPRTSPTFRGRTSPTRAQGTAQSCHGVRMPTTRSTPSWSRSAPTPRTPGTRTQARPRTSSRVLTARTKTAGPGVGRSSTTPSAGTTTIPMISGSTRAPPAPRGQHGPP